MKKSNKEKEIEKAKVEGYERGYKQCLEDFHLIKGEINSKTGKITYYDRLNKKTSKKSK